MKRLRASSVSQRMRGFTLIEIMVVVAIIAVLATIVIVSYQGFGERSRDSQRTSDIAQIKIALDKYYVDNSQYPAVCGAVQSCPVTALATVLNPYLKQIPSDPLIDNSPDNQYLYQRAASGNGYGLKVTYEDRAVCTAGVRSQGMNWPYAWGSPQC